MNNDNELNELNPPVMDGYTKIPTFKLWVANNFPYMETDFDGLTNYGLMGALTNYLNNVLQNEETVESNVASLYQAYLELFNYVKDYFNNLDVQEEINNKLDDLVADGTLTRLIGEYIQPLIDEQNQEIAEFKTSVNEQIDIQNAQIQAVASGSPLVASSLSQMTDTTRVYVLTTNGHWYWYDGNSWQDGGVYQATGLSDNQVKINQLDSIIRNYFDLNGTIDIIEPVFNENTFYNNSGTNTNQTPISNNRLNSSVIDVNPGEIYYIYGYSAGDALCFSVTDNSGLNLIKPQELSNYSFNEVIIPTNGSKLYLNQWHSATDIVITKVNTIKTNKDDLIKIQNDIIKLLIPYNSLHLKSFDTNTGYDNYVRWSSILLNNTEEERIVANNDILEFSCDIYTEDLSKITAFQFWQRQTTTPPNYSVLSVDYNTSNFENKMSIEKINDLMCRVHFRVKAPTNTNANREILFSPSLNTSDTDYDCYVFNFKFRNITKNTDIDVLDNIPNTTTNNAKEIFNFVGENIDIENYIPKIGFNKWYAIGDSITEKNWRCKTNYVDYCTTELKYLTAVNKGLSGSGYKARSGNTFIDRLNEITNYNIDTDIITVMGSVNDSGFVANSLGQLGDTTTDTLYGAMYTFFNTLFTQFNGVRVGCISPINWKGSNSNDTLEKYTKALKDTCEVFNVPFLDITHTCNLRPDNTTFLNEYYMSDTASTGQLDSNGIHPNSKGHRLFANQIKDFITKL